MKMLFVTDAEKFNREQLDFSLYIAGLAKGTITVLFLENMAGQDLFEGKNVAVKKEAIKNNIEAYVQACKEKNIPVVYLRAAGLPFDETIAASRFADLLLLSPDITFRRGDNDIPTIFAEDVLSSAQCPVMVLPKSSQEIDELFFTCNGGYSSMYAIRQFTLMFPSLRNRKVTVLSVTENDDEAIKHKWHIMEYLRSHYTEVEFKTLTGNPASAILAHLHPQKNGLVTFGAYGRTGFSKFFKKSNAEGILRFLHMPVFITHP